MIDHLSSVISDPPSADQFPSVICHFSFLSAICPLLSRFTLSLGLSRPTHTPLLPPSPSQVHRARAEREAAERRLAYEGGQLGLERSRLSEARSRLSSEREELQSLRSRAEEERTRGSELAAEVDGEVGEALGRLERVVQMSFELTEEARHTLSAHQTRMSEREHRLNLPVSPPPL